MEQINMKQLLVEYFELTPTPSLLKETKNPVTGKPMLVVSGKIQAADTPNWNGRIYPRAILEREIKKYQKFISRRNALGELDHPNTAEIKLGNSALNILKIWWEGNEVWADIQVLTTTSGKEIRALLEDGITIAISSRGTGSVQSDGEHDVVEEDFSLAGWDFVHDPSTHEAFMKVKAIEEIKSEYKTEITEEVEMDLLNILNW